MTASAQIVHVIDDDAALRKSLEMLLTTEGFRARTYESPEGFLDSWTAEDDGCIVSDVQMPGMNGIDLLAKLKEKKITAPVVMMTAFADVPLAIQAMKLGAVDFIEKPYDSEALLARLRAALAVGRMRKTHENEIESAKGKLERLSPREVQVFVGVVNGKANKDIADALGVSMRSVEKRRANMMAKLDASAMSDLVRLALLAAPRTFEEGRQDDISH